MKRGGTAVGLLAAMLCVGLTACRDNGLPDRNLPLQEAVNREFGYPVYEPVANSAPIAHGGRHWLRSAPVESIPTRLLVQVGNAEGTLLYARRGEEAPYSRLYSPVATNRWIPWLSLN